MKNPLTGILLAGAAAVLPTMIVASLSAQSTTPAPAPTDPQANASPGFTEPTTQPDAAPNAAPGPRANGGPRDGGGLGGGGFFSGEGRNRPGGQFGPRGEDFQAETQAAIAFFNENSPNRMAYFSKLPENSPARRVATANLVRLYHPIENFKDTNPVLYALLVKQVKLRDDAFQLAKDGKEEDLRSKAIEIVGVTIDARHMRLEILQKELAEQQENLEKYTANRDDDAEQEAAAIKSDEERMVQRVEHLQNREHSTSMLDFDPAGDPLADAAPITPRIDTPK